MRKRIDAISLTIGFLSTCLYMLVGMVLLFVLWLFWKWEGEDDLPPP